MKTFTAKEGYLYIKDGITAKEICLPDNENEWELINENDAPKTIEISEVELNSSNAVSNEIENMMEFDDDRDTIE